MRIKLRGFKLADAETVAQLVGDEDVSRWTSNIPFPYSEQDAIDWIGRTSSDNTRSPFAIEMDGGLVGCVSYWSHEPGGIEVGYWVGKHFWGKGICTKALQIMIATKCPQTSNGVFARVMSGNIGSQRVLEKCGFSSLRRDTITKKGQEIEAWWYVRRPTT